MPDTLETPIAPPQPAAPAAEPAAQPAPQPKSTDTAIGRAMADFDDAVTPKKADVKAEPKVEPAAPAKPAAKAAPAKPDAKPADEVDWEKADPRYRGAHFKAKRALESKVTDYERKIADIEAKSKNTVADTKLVEEYQSRIKALEQDLAVSSFERSAEFKTAYVEKWNGEYKSAVDEIKHLTVMVPTPEGETQKTRPATEQDFQRILRLPPGEQDEAIQAFGRHSSRVFTRIMELQRIERASQEAVANHAKTLETRTKEQEMSSQREQKAYEEAHRASVEELATKWPEHFAPDDADQEITEALNKGYAFVDSVLKKSETLSSDERAAYNAVIRARAGAFPRKVLEANRLAAKVKGLEDELKKYRKSDPGAGGQRPSQNDPAEPEVGGIAGMAARFNEK